ncbi:hypothetical protein VPHD378_0165 [Vibrio phage D378]
MAYFNEEDFDSTGGGVERVRYLLNCDKRVEVTIDTMLLDIKRVVYLSAADAKPVTILTNVTDEMQDAPDEELIEAVEAHLMEKLI